MATNVSKLSADGGIEREILYVRYQFSQQTDVEGQPSGPARGGKIFVRVKSTNDGDTKILEWMLDSYMSKTGKIVFINQTDGNELKVLNFKGGYVVDYAETYDSTNSQQQCEEFTISAKEIEIGGVNHNNRWTIDN